MTLSNTDLTQPVVYAGMLAFLDIMDGVTPDPIRAALAQFDITVPNGLTGDADIDGQTFQAVDPQFVNVGPVTQKEGGSDTVTLTVSGTIALDSGLLNQLASPANFRGRIAKLLIFLSDGAGTVTATRFHYVGYMQSPLIAFEPDSQVVAISVENYLSAYSGGAPARTLLNQRAYDADDASADATAGAMNGTQAAGADFGAPARYYEMAALNAV